MTDDGGAETTILLSAGESSGDLHGARLAARLRERIPGVRLVGLGGSRMEAAGVELMADLDTLAVMGFAEVLGSLPSLLAVRWRVWRLLDHGGVDLVIPIDYPGFNLALACRARDAGVPCLYYIAPQVWAWRRKRARRLADCAHRVCVVLPFEEELLAAHGADVRFVGHPLLDEAAAGELPVADDVAAGGTDPASDRGEDAGAGGRGDDAGGDGKGPVLGLFPGSRVQEVRRLLPPFREAAARLRDDHPGLRAVVARAPDLPRDLFPAGPDAPGLAPPETVLAAATAALAKSGTVTLQLALADVPMVVAYRMHPLTHWIARRLVSVDDIALANLVAGRRVVPELVQDEVTPGRLARLADPLLCPGSPDREAMRRGLADVRDRLGEPGCAGRVAGHAEELLGRGDAA